MNSLSIALVLIVVLVLVWRLQRSRNVAKPEARQAEKFDTLVSWPPTATRVLTTAERQAYDVLRSALPAHMILAQVPLQRFIKVPTRNSYAEWLRRVGQLSADLLVCDRHSQVVAVVEVHVIDEVLSARAERRRQRLAKVLKAAEIPLHVWPATNLPTPVAAREAIAPSLPPVEMSPAAEVTVLRSLPGRFPQGDTVPDDMPEMREPPPSTWFDDLDTQPAPLAPEVPKLRTRSTR